jgi:hypothetical protein
MGFTVVGFSTQYGALRELVLYTTTTSLASDDNLPCVCVCVPTPLLLLFPFIHISGICTVVENLLIHIAVLWHVSSAVLFCHLKFGVFVYLRSRDRCFKSYSSKL